MELKRNFTHGPTETNFGEVAIVFPVDGWTLNGKELPESSVAAIVNQGLQILQDAYAGCGASKTVDESVAAFNGKLEKLLDGSIGVRGEGTPKEPEFVKLARELFVDHCKAHKDTDSAKAKVFNTWNTLKKTDDESRAVRRTNYVETIFGKSDALRDYWHGEAKKELARRAKAVESAKDAVDLSDIIG